AGLHNISGPFKEETPGDKWNAPGDYNSPALNNRSVILRARDGRVIRTIRYYRPEQAPDNITTLVKEEYGNKSMWGLTEIENAHGRCYVVTLADSKNFYLVNIDIKENNKLVKRFKRGDK